MCNDILGGPADFYDYVKLALGRIILSTIYGIEVESKENRFLKEIDTFNEWIVDNAVPGKHLCDMFPWMVYLPKWLPFHRSAQHGKELFKHVTTRPFGYVKEQMASGTALPSAVRTLLEEAKDNVTDEWEHTIKHRAAAMYGDGPLIHLESHPFLIKNRS